MRQFRRLMEKIIVAVTRGERHLIIRDNYGSRFAAELKRADLQLRELRT